MGVRAVATLHDRNVHIQIRGMPVGNIAGTALWKPDGSVELHHGLEKALQKRRVSIQKIEFVSGNVEVRVRLPFFLGTRRIKLTRCF